MKKTTLVSAIGLSTALILPTAATADTLGFRIGANLWQQELSGDVKSGNLGTNIDIENDLGYKDSEDNANFYIAFEHPLPFIPNVRLARTELELSGENNTSVVFDGTTYTGNLKSTTDLSHTDATLYYEILDNWVSLDIGITARMFDEGFTLTGTTAGGTQTSTINVDATIPMLYAAVKFELPLTGLYILAEGNAISYDGDGLYDYKAGLGYETSLGFGVEAGFRSFAIKYEDSSDESIDLTIDGMYAGLFYHF